MNLYDFISSQPEVIFTVVLICSISVIGIADFIKCWVTSKKAVKWIVLWTSLAIAIINSHLVPPVLTTIIDIWLLTLSVSTIARNAVVDGLPALVSKMMGSIKNTQGENRDAVG